MTVDFLRSMSRANGSRTIATRGFVPSNPTQTIPIEKPIRSTDFKDGLSNTMLFSENNQAQPWYLTRLTGNAAHLKTFATIGTSQMTAYPVESRYLQGAVWHFEDDLGVAGASPVSPRHKINGGDPYNEQMTSTNFADLARPSSLHVTGVNMAMASGSVHFVNESVELSSLSGALLTPNGRSSDMPASES